MMSPAVTRSGVYISETVLNDFAAFDEWPLRADIRIVEPRTARVTKKIDSNLFLR